MATRSTNTQAEALLNLLKEIAEVKTYPDADIPWLIDLETVITAKLREPVEQALSGGGVPQAPMGAMGGMGGAMGGGAAGGGGPGAGPEGLLGTAAAGAGQSRGPSPAPGLPNPDEIRRMLNSGS